jgi:hypothetical protein
LFTISVSVFILLRLAQLLAAGDARAAILPEFISGGRAFACENSPMNSSSPVHGEGRPRLVTVDGAEALLSIRSQTQRGVL